MASRSSALFAPYRQVGVVGEGVPAIYALGGEPFLAVGAGKSFQVYKVDHLAVTMVSAPLQDRISHVAVWKESSFTATSGGTSGARPAIVAWKRAKPLRTLTWGGRTPGAAPAPVLSLLVLGDYLLSLHEDDVIRAWDAKAAATTPAASEGDGEAFCLGVVELPPGTDATCFMHPDTYLNKVAVGTGRGSVLIVNIRTGKVVHECARVSGRSAASGPASVGASITCLAQSPAVDVIAAGTSDGGVMIHNLRGDAHVAAFSHARADAAAARGRVTALAFSQPGGGATGGTGAAGAAGFAGPTLASVTDTGALALWDLPSRSLQALVPGAHGGPITAVAWVPGSPGTLLTVGGDNAIHVWAVDKLDGQPKILKSRTGHRAPPRLVRYYGGAAVASLASGANAAACEVVSTGGADRAVRAFHTALDRQATELSQGHLVARARELGGVDPNSLRLPPVTALAVSDRRHAQWSDVVTAHTGDYRAYCWSWEPRKLDNRVLPLPDPTETVTAVTISSCGHFAVIGGSRGTIAKFNLQSGARRGTFPKDPILGDGDVRAAGRGNRPRALPDGLERLPPTDRDTGKGKGAGHQLHLADSVETTLFKAMGIVPKALQAKMAAARAAAGVVEAPAKSGSGSGGSSKAAAPAAPAIAPHSAAVYGLGVDLLNSILVSADGEGRVLFWDFGASHAAVGELRLPAPVSGLVLHRDSGLAAAICDDFVVRVLDVTSRRIVRSLGGHTNRVTDVAFSPDGRWAVTTSLDRTAWVWDLPTGRGIDWLAFEHAPLSVAFSPTSEFLVTAHADELGLCVWANKAHFGGGARGLAAASGAGATPSAPVYMDAPGLTMDGDALSAAQGGSSGEGEAAEGEGGADGEGATPPPAKRARLDEDKPASSQFPAASLSSASITLSGLPASSWQNLTRLDAIAARNKPAVAPAKPEGVPFFLPTTTAMASQKTLFVVPGADKKGAAGAVGGSSSSAAEGWSSAWADADEGEAAPPAPAADDGGGVEVKGRIIKSSGARMARTVLAGLLREGLTAALAASDGSLSEGDVPQLPASTLRAVHAHLCSLGPAVVDVEVRSLCLGPGDAEGLALLGALLAYFQQTLAAGRGALPVVYADLLQAQLALTLQVYSETLAATPALLAVASQLKAAVVEAGRPFRAALDQTLCLVGSLLGQ